MASAILTIVLIQLAFIAGVLFILRKVLERILVNSGIKNFESFKFERDDSNPLADITVTSYRELKSLQKQKILQATLRNYGPQAKVDFQVDKGIWGGLLIQAEDSVIDLSLRHRLKESGISWIR